MAPTDKLEELERRQLQVVSKMETVYEGTLASTQETLERRLEQANKERDDLISQLAGLSCIITRLEGQVYMARALLHVSTARTV